MILKNISEVVHRYRWAARNEYIIWGPGQEREVEVPIGMQLLEAHPTRFICTSDEPEAHALMVRMGRVEVEKEEPMTRGELELAVAEEVEGGFIELEDDEVVEVANEEPDESEMISDPELRETLTPADLGPGTKPRMRGRGRPRS